MGDASASPNDPFFIVHHIMIDCIFDEWLKRHPDAEYPDVPLINTTKGYQAHSYMTPFFPPVTNAEIFKQARNFGYFCNLPNISDSETQSGDFPRAQVTLFTWLSTIFLSIIMLY